MTKPTQDELKTFVSNNVIINQSMLVDELLKKEIFSYEDIANLYSNDNDNDTEDYQEILEWWLCDNWLLEKLEEQGEPILKTDYHNYWGRTCSGQAIYLDSVIETIYSDIKIK